jgi:hypothetical protein
MKLLRILDKVNRHNSCHLLVAGIGIGIDCTKYKFNVALQQPVDFYKWSYGILAD